MTRHAAAMPLALAVTLALSLASSPAAPQQSVSLTLPLASPRAQLSQVIGLTQIDITYHRPAVNGRVIWGDLVPYGQVWRTGANENTLISFSTGVNLEGQLLAAGTYGLHTLPGESQWQVIFSHDTAGWGSFSYDEAQDALRVAVQPVAAAHAERLTFTFEDVTDDSAVILLRWEELQLPIRVEVDTQEIALASIRDQLKGLSQFFWMGWNQAADYCLQKEINYPEALQWVDNSIQAEERFENLSTRAQLLERSGDQEEAAATMARALEIATALQLHQHGRQLISQGRQQEAMRIFERNAEQHPDAWFIGVGLARGQAALGRFDEATASMRTALDKAPDDQKAYLYTLLDRLERGQDIN